MKKYSLSVLISSILVSLNLSALERGTYTGGRSYVTSAFSYNGTDYPTRNGVDSCHVNLSESTGFSPGKKKSIFVSL
ncbi:MAG: hypothetical protein ACK5P5_01380 [Pseudobdellovibrionaceae bacterium]